MNFKDIIYKIDGEYANIIINRPKVYNAFTPETLHELKKALDLSTH